MPLEPQKFFINLLDFFSVILPGMLLTYLLGGGACAALVEPKVCAAADPTERALVFVVASYLAGHLVFLVGALALDPVFDELRTRTVSGQVARLSRSGGQSWWLTRACVWFVFKGEADRALARASELRQRALRPLAAERAINTFQWSKALLARTDPDGFALVQRFEADSKFFRSFVVVLVVLLLASRPADTGWVRPLALGGMLVPAFWRYVDLRHKSTNQAYWSVLALKGEQGAEALEPSRSGRTAAAFVGGAVFRARRGRLEYLLVEDRDTASRWTLPTAEVEPGGSPEAAAIRGVHDEAGWWAVPAHRVGLEPQGEVQVLFFLMHCRGLGRATDPSRRRQWLTLEEVERRTDVPSATRRVLELAEERRRAHARPAPQAP